MQLSAFIKNYSHKSEVHIRLKVYGKHWTLHLLMKIINFFEAINIDLFEHVYMFTREYNSFDAQYCINFFSSFSKWFYVTYWLTAAPLQLLLTGPRHIELTKRRACVLLKKTWTVGLSLVSPLCGWHLKIHKGVLAYFVIKHCPCSSGRE